MMHNMLLIKLKKLKLAAMLQNPHNQFRRRRPNRMLRRPNLRRLNPNHPTLAVTRADPHLVALSPTKKKNAAAKKDCVSFAEKPITALRTVAFSRPKKHEMPANLPANLQPHLSLLLPSPPKPLLIAFRESRPLRASSGSDSEVSFRCIFICQSFRA